MGVVSDEVATGAWIAVLLCTLYWCYYEINHWWHFEDPRDAVKRERDAMIGHSD
jgi:hypothetical protein